MKRRNFIVNLLLWVLAFLFGYSIKNGNKISEKTNDLSTQLVHMTNNVVYLESFKRKMGETDDTGRFQRAIDSFDGNFAGTIIIPKKVYISRQVTCNKTGLVLKGLGNKVSKIISSYAGIAIFIKPLYNGAPYTNTGYCKFYIDNVAIQAEGDAITSGTGLWLQWIYACSFMNLYTSGFAKHIVLKGSHLNTFYNLYQENADASDQGMEIHNRGIGLLADGSTDEARETTSNNNHIIGGWLHNTSWDLTNLDGTITEKIDIEPASNSIITGDNAIFKECRFERFDYYVVNGSLYPAFPWFVVGSNCKFKDNEYYQSGASQTPENPIFQINGDYNRIEIPDKIPYNAGLMSFGDTAKGNTIEYNAVFDDYQNTGENTDFKQEYASIKYNNEKNRIIFKDNVEGTITDIIGSHTKAQGEFICRNSKNVNIVNSPDYLYQECTSVTVDIALPIGRESLSTAFTKIALTSGSGNRSMHLNIANGQVVSKAGVYTLTATVYVPSTSTANLKIGATLGTLTEIDTKDRWVTVRSRVWLNKGEQIIPSFRMLGVTGDVFYVGEISVCDGNTSAYIPNDTYEAVSESFNTSSIKM